MNQELTTQNQTDNSMLINDTNSVIFNPTLMQQVSAIANMMASSKITVPQHLRGSPGDCFAIALQAANWRLNPWAVAQKSYISQSGALAFESQLISAVITANAGVTGAPQYEFIGDWDKILGKVEEKRSEKGGKYFSPTYSKADETGLGVICRMTLKGEDSPREMKVMMSQCYPRFSTQWATDPKMQISYVAIRKWSRLFSPGTILGIYSPEEAESIYTEKEINPIPTDNTKTSEILNKLANKKQASPEPKDALVESEPLTSEVVDAECPDDEYADLKRQISDCKNKGQLTKIYNALSTEDKAAMKDVAKSRQDEFNKIMADMKQAAKANAPVVETEPEQPTEQPEQDWESVIRSRKSAEQLTILLNDADPSVEIEFAAVIDEVFDSFRGVNSNE
jgi:hypothetical protein